MIKELIESMKLMVLEMKVINAYLRNIAERIKELADKED